MPAPRLPFYSNCVGWPEDKLRALHYLIDHSNEVERGTYLRHVSAEDRQAIERGLGYGRDFKAEKDWHVRYHHVPGVNIWFMKHSAIEYVFATDEQIERAQELGLAEDLGDEAEEGDDIGEEPEADGAAPGPRR